MNNQIQQIFRDVLDDDSLIITRATTFNQINDWDSVILIDVLMALENEFGIKVNIDEAQSIKSVEDIFKLIETKAK